MVNLKSERIMIISNEPDLVTTVKMLFSEKGISVEDFNSYSDSLNALKKNNFDLLIFDMALPDVESVAFLISAMETAPDILCIVMASHERIQSVVEMIKIGFFDYILKPYKPETLLMTVTRALEIQQLRKTRDLYKTIYENSTEGIYLMSPDKQYVTVNPAMVHILGYDSPDEFLNNINDARLELYVDSDRNTQLLNLAQEKENVSNFISQMYRKNGKKIWVSENIRSIRNSQGKLMYLRGTLEDITLRKEAEDVLRKNESYARMRAETVERNTGFLIEMIEEICESHKKLETLVVDLVGAVVNALDETNRWTKGHSKRVALYAERIARAMRLKEEEINRLRLAALLHDIGKIGILDHLIEKQEKLTIKEYEIIKKHPVRGASILNKVNQLKDIIPFVRHHHERIDGKGYPDGLKGENIPLCARILNIADSFASMTTDRPYRPFSGREYAFNELKRCNGSQFDPQITEIAIKVL